MALRDAMAGARARIDSLEDAIVSGTAIDTDRLLEAICTLVKCARELMPDVEVAPVIVACLNVFDYLNRRGN